MKKNALHHRLPNQVLDWVLNKALNQKRGSIMIWTVMLGLLLTSVFFFFSMRQRMMVSVQRDTSAMQNAKLFAESYADYLEKYPIDPPGAVEGISASLSKNVDSIENSVDFGLEKKQSYDFSGSIYVEWNRCSDSLKGDLLVNDVLYSHSELPACGPNDKYDDVIGPISVSSPFTLKTLNAPFRFRIKSAEDAPLVDNQWHLEVTKDLDYGKKVTIRRTFPVAP